MRFIASDEATRTRAFLDARQVCRLNELRETEPANEPVPRLGSIADRVDSYVALRALP